MPAKRPNSLSVAIVALGSMLIASEAGAIPCATTDISLTVNG